MLLSVLVFFPADCFAAADLARLEARARERAGVFFFFFGVAFFFFRRVAFVFFLAGGFSLAGVLRSSHLRTHSSLPEPREHVGHLVLP